jgi:hypothetical protein
MSTARHAHKKNTTPTQACLSFTHPFNVGHFAFALLDPLPGLVEASHGLVVELGAELLLVLVLLRRDPLLLLERHDPALLVARVVGHGPRAQHRRLALYQARGHHASGALVQGESLHSFLKLRVGRWALLSVLCF